MFPFVPALLRTYVTHTGPAGKDHDPYDVFRIHAVCFYCVYYKFPRRENLSPRKSPRKSPENIIYVWLSEKFVINT